MWAWIPERKILAPGDLFIWATPNAGNPQKVQRFPGSGRPPSARWRRSAPSSSMPGHGLPVFGAERIRAALTDTAGPPETIESQVLALINPARPSTR